MPETLLSIGGMYFRLTHDGKIKKDKKIEPFIVGKAQADVDIVYLEDADVPNTEVHSSENYRQITVHYHPDLARRFSSLRGCLMHVPVEKIFLAHDRFFLHASFVTSPWGGLLFTGDSGVGKSTQAELWRQHMGSTIINGDRVIVAHELMQAGGKNWLAYGSPYAGSSGYYVRRDAPICAIVLLEQAKENTVHAVGVAEAFQRLFLQISIDHSQTEAVERLCDLLMELIRDIPVYRLRCTADSRAVDTLKSELCRKTRQNVYPS